MPLDRRGDGGEAQRIGEFHRPTAIARKAITMHGGHIDIGGANGNALVKKLAALVDEGEEATLDDLRTGDRPRFASERQAMTVDTRDPVGVYFGTTSGEIWASADEGASWRCLARHLPEIYSVEHADPVSRR